MIFNMSGGGGNAKLNVVAYASAFPASAKEDTIGIISDTPVSGYYFSSDKPAEPNDGAVWIKANGYSPTPIFVSKTIVVYPLAAEQYKSGSWTSVEAKTYQSGEWKSWIKKLYWTGTDSIDIRSYNDDVSFMDSYIHIHPGSAHSVRACSYNKVDVSDYRYLCLELVYNGGYTFSVGLHPTYNTDITEPSIVKSSPDKESGIHRLDISAYSGEYHIKLANGSEGAGGRNWYVNKIWLEG